MHTELRGIIPTEEEKEQFSEPGASPIRKLCTKSQQTFIYESLTGNYFEFMPSRLPSSPSSTLVAIITFHFLEKLP